SVTPRTSSANFACTYLPILERTRFQNRLLRFARFLLTPAGRNNSLSFPTDLILRRALGYWKTSTAACVSKKRRQFCRQDCQIRFNLISGSIPPVNNLPF